jgi:cyclophilin family peptidyl-prolyl cis-trans isomerase
MRRAALAKARKREQRKRQSLYAGVAVVVVAALVGGYFALHHGSSKKSVSTTATSAPGDSTTAVTQPSPPKAGPSAPGATLTGDTPCPKADGTSPRTTSFAKAPPLCIDAKKTYTATFDTSAGVVKVALDTKRTPMTANNFVVLSLYHYYDGTSFDRVDDSLDIIQGGSPKTQDITDPGPGYNIQDEGGKFSYSPGDLTMARGQAANSGSAQYFFVTGPKASQLDSQGTYVTFGHTSAGLDVLQKVETTVKPCPADQSDPGCLGGRPDPVVTVNTVTITAA